MRSNPSHIWDVWKTGEFVGANRPHGRVTVVPSFQVNESATAPSAFFAGPSRYWLDTANPATEVEVPGVVEISTDFDIDADTSTAKIKIANTDIDATPAAAAAVPTIVVSRNLDGTESEFLNGSILGGQLQIMLVDADADTVGTSPSSAWASANWQVFTGPNGGGNTTVSPILTRFSSFYLSGGAFIYFDGRLLARRHQGRRGRRQHNAAPASGRAGQIRRAGRDLPLPLRHPPDG